MIDPTGGSNAQEAPRLFDLAGLDGITNRDEYMTRLQGQMRGNLQLADAIPGSEGVTKPAETLPDFGSFLSKTYDQVKVHQGPKGFEREPGAYREDRFNFIAAHEGHRRTVYKDEGGLRHIGFGFNLETPENRKTFLRALSVDDKYFDEVLNGKRDLTKAQTRTLFEASVNDAESIINNTFKDVPLTQHQRVALVSLAFNSPKLIGPKLTKAIKTGDWQAADFEIRHNSNRHNSKGLAKRRRSEANMFGGVDTDVRQFADSKNYGQKIAEKLIVTALGVSNAEAATMTSPRGTAETIAKMEPKRQQEVFTLLPDNMKMFGAFMMAHGGKQVKDAVEGVLGLEPKQTKTEKQGRAHAILDETALSPQTIEPLYKVVSQVLKQGKVSVEYSDWDEAFGKLRNGLYPSQLTSDVAARRKLQKSGKISTTEKSDRYSGVMGYGRLFMDSKDDNVLTSLTTLGGLALYRDNEGNVVLEDPYDFGKYTKGPSEDAYGTMRWLAGKIQQPGFIPFAFRINLGKFPNTDVSKLPLAPGLAKPSKARVTKPL